MTQRSEPSMFYDPPYARPLEDEFAWHLVKYLRPIARLHYQVKVSTPCTEAWVDFVVEHDGTLIGFQISELDETDPRKDRYLDALVMGSGRLDVLYRLSAHGMATRPHDCIRLIAAWDPALFSPRGLRNLEVLASEEVSALTRTQDVGPGQVEVELGETDLHMRRLSLANPTAWMPDYDAALIHYGVSHLNLLEAPR